MVASVKLTSALSSKMVHARCDRDLRTTDHRLLTSSLELSWNGGGVFKKVSGRSLTSLSVLFLTAQVLKYSFL